MNFEIRQQQKKLREIQRDVQKIWKWKLLLDYLAFPIPFIRFVKSDRTKFSYVFFPFISRMTESKVKMQNLKG